MNSRYTKQHFYWWMTQDERYWWDTWFLYWENIDPISNTWFVELSKLPTKWIYTKVWSQYRVRMMLDIWTDVLFFTDDNIFSLNWWDAFSIARLPTNYIEFQQVWTQWDYFYMTAVNTNPVTPIISLHRALISDVAPTITAAIENWLSILDVSWSFTGATYPDYDSLNRFYTVEQIWTSTYLGIYKKIYEIDHILGTITEFDIFNSNVVWMDYVWWSFKVVLENWQIALWDWYSQGISDISNTGQSAFWSTQIADQEFVFTWSTWATAWENLTTLNLLNWFTFEKLFSISKSDVLWTKRFRIEYNWIQSLAIINNLLCMVDKDDNLKDRLAVFWNNVAGFPRAYFILNTHSSEWIEFNNITSLKSIKQKLYIWYDNWTHIWVDVVDFWVYADSNYNASWYIVTNLEDMDDKLSRKANNTLITKVSWIDATHTITPSINTDWWGFTALTTLTTQPKFWIAKETKVWDFRDIAFKYTLTSWDWLTSPRIYWLMLEYENQWV